MWLLSTFSVSMLSQFGKDAVDVRFYPASLDEAREVVQMNVCESAVGHADIASIMSSQLGIDVPMNRKSVKLERGDYALLCQYMGPRLPEGSTTLPEGAALQWFVVYVLKVEDED